MAIKVIDKDLGLKKYLEDMKRQFRGAHVTVGVQGSVADEIHPDSDLTLGELAGILEFGSPARNIPARPAITGTFEANKNELLDQLARDSRAIVNQDATAQIALERAGERTVAKIRSAITAGIGPANAASTIAAKGSSTPLIDTGEYLHAINWEYHDGR